MKLRYLLGGVLLLGALFTVKSLARASYEQARYKVVEKLAGFEVREYEECLMLSVETSGKFRESMNGSFRKLAGYIFGKNERQEKIAMTSPVTMEFPEDGKAPKMAFLVPSKYSKKDLPKPDNGEILMEEQPKRLVAAIRFAGKVNREMWEQKSDELLASVEESDYRIIGEPQLLGYDPPAVPGPLRRNEVIVEIRPAKSTGD